MGVELKHTEIGDIPADWKVQTFEETFRVLSNNTLSRDALNNRGGSVRNIHYGDILVKFSEVLDCSKEDIPYITDTSMLGSSAMPLQDGDIVIADTAEDDAVGKVTEITGVGDGKLVAGLHTIPCRVKKGDFAPGWLGYYMNSHAYHNQILPFVTGIKVSSISKKSLFETVILVPPVDKQKEIISALADIDGLIFNLRRSIKKSIDVKLGGLQRLFPSKGEITPKIRLQGYLEEWKHNELVDVTDRVIVGLATSVTPYYRSTGVPLLRNMNIKENYLDDSDLLFLDEEYASSNVSKQIHVDDVLTVHTGSNIGLTCITPQKYDNCLSFTTLITTPRKGVLNSEFVMQYINSPMGKNGIEAIITAGGKANLNTKDFEKFMVYYPEYSEQLEISRILGDIDRLVDEYKYKLEKYMAIKSGIMTYCFVVKN